MMNKVAKRAWLKALRSGNYRQTQSQLKEKYPGERVKYCCLGVLCAITPEVTLLHDDDFMFGDERQGGKLGRKFLKTLGITEAQQAKLIDLNDLENKNFREIADHIEAKL